MKTAELGLPLRGRRRAAASCSPRRHRDALRAACAEDPEIWAIYSMDFGPEDFDREHRPDQPATSATGPSCCSRATRWSACRASSASTRARQVLEIGGTYYRPALRGTGFNRRAKDMMLRPRLRLRRAPGRVPGRRAQRAQPGGDGEARRGARGRAARRPDHLDRPCPRHRALLDPREWNASARSQDCRSA